MERKLIVSRLIECRTKMGISKMEAAKRIGISQPAYLRYESGERTPSIQVIKEIAKVLNTSAEFLIGTTDTSKVNEYVIQEKDNPDLFFLIEKYLHAEETQRRKFLAYLQSIK